MTEKSKFDNLASIYAAARPTYPSGIFDAIEELSGRRFEGADVVDIGAGTGISARQMRDRGASVTAVDLSGPMLRQLVADSPGVGAVQGSANAIPLRDEAVDFVTFGQAWHWVDPELAVPEAFRVLRNGGVLACFWNIPTLGTPWRVGYGDRIREALGRDPEYGNGSTGLDQETQVDLGSHESRLTVRFAEVDWSRGVTIEQRLANVASRSYFWDIPEERRDAYLDRERAHLEKHFPDGTVVEEYTTSLSVVTEQLRTPSHGAAPVS